MDNLCSQVSYTAISAGDVSKLARLHSKAFPTFFLSTLGERFLRQFYRGFLGDDTAVTVVARQADGRVLGCVVGTTDPARYFPRFLRRHFPGLAAASALALVRRPRALARLLRGLTYRGQAAGHHCGALLSSVCVDPAAQGEGIGRQLVDLWCQRAAARGTSTAYLTTDAEDNAAVNQFYRSAGWTLTEAFVNHSGRRMHMYTKDLGTT